LIAARAANMALMVAAAAAFAPPLSPPLSTRPLVASPFAAWPLTAPPPLVLARASTLTMRSGDSTTPVPSAAAAAAAAVFLLAAPLPASAAGAAYTAVPSALAAYGHYFALILTVACLTVERLTVKENMSGDEEDRMALADALYGVAGLLVVVTGYLRVTEYGKGWEFYAHEPIFWLKLSLVAVAGASSFFPTIKIIQRSVAKRNNGGELVAPMSAKLAARMTSIINAELLAIASIPLTATLMARGVGYADWLPWQAGAAPALLLLLLLGYKYVKEALDWQEDETSAPPPASADS